MKILLGLNGSLEYIHFSIAIEVCVASTYISMALKLNIEKNELETTAALIKQKESVFAKAKI